MSLSVNNLVESSEKEIFDNGRFENVRKYNVN